MYSKTRKNSTILEWREYHLLKCNGDGVVHTTTRLPFNLEIFYFFCIVMSGL